MNNDARTLSCSRITLFSESEASSRGEETGMEKPCDQPSDILEPTARLYAPQF